MCTSPTRQLPDWEFALVVYLPPARLATFATETKTPALAAEPTSTVGIPTRMVIIINVSLVLAQESINLETPSEEESAAAAPATARIAQPMEQFALSAMPLTSCSHQPATESSTLVSHAVTPTIISSQPSQMEAESADSAKTQ